MTPRTRSPSPGGGGGTPSESEAAGGGDTAREREAAGWGGLTRRRFTPPRLTSFADPPPPGEGEVERPRALPSILRRPAFGRERHVHRHQHDRALAGGNDLMRRVRR